MTRFKPQVGNVKTGQTTGGFTVINPSLYVPSTVINHVSVCVFFFFSILNLNYFISKKKRDEL